MSAILSSLLWLADRCWWIVYKHTRDVTCMRVNVQLFLGEPDAMGSYEVVSLTKDYGPKLDRIE
jgi:hypothetical protein